MTLEADAEAAVRRLMRERGLTFKQAVNEAIRAGTTPRRAAATRFRTRTFDMGEPKLPLDKALRLAGELEDAEIIRKLQLRK